MRTRSAPITGCICSGRATARGRPTRIGYARLREHNDRDGDPSGTVIDARSARGASTVTGSTRGYDAGKKISGRKTYGMVDRLLEVPGSRIAAGQQTDFSSLLGNDRHKSVNVGAAPDC